MCCRTLHLVAVRAIDAVAAHFEVITGEDIHPLNLLRRHMDILRALVASDLADFVGFALAAIVRIGNQGNVVRVSLIDPTPSLHGCVIGTLILEGDVYAVGIAVNLGCGIVKAFS